MAEEKKTLRFKGALILLCIALTVGATYFFYLLPASKERELTSELLKRFLRVDAEDVEFLRIQNKKGLFDMVKEGKEWKIKSPLMLQTDTKTIQMVMDVIKKGKILKVITKETEKAHEYGLDNPYAVLYIGYKGRMDELVLGSMNPSKTGIYAFAKGINAIFLVDKEIAGALSVGLYELRSKALFSFDPETIVKVNIRTKKDGIELIKGQKGWRVARPIEGRAGDEAVKTYILEILNQRADEFYDNRVPDPKEYRDSIKLLFYSRKNFPSYDIDVHYRGTGAREGVVAYQKGMKYSGRLPREFWNSVNKDASYFRYRNLFNFDEENLSGIWVKKDSLEYRLIKKGETWFLRDKPVDQRKVLEFVWFLKAWRAERLLGPSVKGKDKSKIEIGIEDKTGRLMGAVRVYGKMEGGRPGHNEKEKNELYYAVSDNLNEQCAVNSVDFEKIPEKKELAE